jgi:hypothetical protein
MIMNRPKRLHDHCTCHFRQPHLPGQDLIAYLIPNHLYSFPGSRLVNSLSVPTYIYLSIIIHLIPMPFPAHSPINITVFNPEFS